MSYVQFGPWVDGSSPGISAEFLNPLESFLLSINSAATDSHISSNGLGTMTLPGLVLNGGAQIDPTGIVLNGGTSGTATLYQIGTGTYKLVLVVLANFRTAASNQTIALPAPFVSTAFVVTGWIGPSSTIAGIKLLASGTAQTFELLTSLATTGGGVSAVTSIFGQSFAYVNAGFDTVQFNSGSSATSNGLILIQGI